MQTYLFYDIETTGLNKSFDQVLQFAAIRTDLNLKELDRHELKIKLNPDVIPSPYAILTHKLGIHAMADGLTEFSAIKQIHQWLNQPGTISLGYNTLGFDDEFLRFSFYRNLLKPYTHQFANQCGRMDIFPMTAMFYLYKNQVLTWPEQNNKLSLKLENLNTANQLVQGRAHDAMVDVEATLELAKRLMVERDMWDYLHGYFKKETDNERMNALRTDIALLVNTRLGSQLAFQAPVLFLGTHQHYKNQTVWLRLDSDDFATLDSAELISKLWTFNKKPAEPNFILPYKERFLTRLSPERSLLAEKNKQWLHQHPEIAEKITQHFTQYTFPVFPTADAQSRLYVEGFLSAEDEFFCQRFHTATPEEKCRLMNSVKNSNLRQLALRVLGRHFGDVLTGELADRYAEYLESSAGKKNAEEIIDFQGNKRLMPKQALLEIQAIRNERELGEEDQQLLDEFEKYLQVRFGVGKVEVL